MTVGLNVSTIVNVSVSLSPVPTPVVNLNTLLLLGDSDIIDVHQRIRTYTSLSQVAVDFGTSVAEYQSAALYYGQNPQPLTLYIGRWASTATKGLALGGPLNTAQQAISNWTPITNGGFHLTVDGGSSTNVTGINLSAQTNLNGVATQIQNAIQGLGGSFTSVICVWNGTQFEIFSGTTGTSSSVSALTAPTAGQDISAQLLLTAATLTYLQSGIAAESALAAVVLFDTAVPTSWYELSFATNTTLSDPDRLSIAGYIEGSSNKHLYGLATASAAALIQPDTTSIGAQLKALGYNRTLYQWSNTSPARSHISIFGRMNSVDFAGTDSTITLMFKQEPGVIPITITASQAAALDANNYNYFANFNNGTAIIVNGKVASGQFIDTIWGVDGLASQIQVNCYNILYTSPKVPQTDKGMTQLNSGISAACAQYNNNGFLATGVWTAPGVGQLQTGQTVPNGFYIYQPPVALQSPADRAARKSVPFQVAAKLAGAVHSVNVLIDVNP